MSCQVLGPFPIHAREQHYLSPSFPLNLSEPICYTSRWRSSYADGGTVTWSKATIAHDGTLEISFPHIRWASLRATEGWAALQHHAVLRTTLTIYPPTTPVPMSPPRLLVDLKQASYFAIRPHAQDVSTFVPEWYAGNIYDMEHALPHTVPLPSEVSLSEPTKFDLFVSGDYEIRLFGDPLVFNSQIPVQRISVNVSISDRTSSIRREPSQDVTCDFVSGYAFGNCIGIGLQSVSGSWTVTEVRPRATTKFICLRLLGPIEIAPTQTRIIPIILSQEAPSFEDSLLLDVVLRSADAYELLSVSLEVKHYSTLEPLTSIRCTYLYADSMPTAFLVVPPKSPGGSGVGPPMLALHGAGVDIFHHEFWQKSLPEYEHGWTIIPSGRTSWGLDWHGPSAKDAWSSLAALMAILSDASKIHHLPEKYQIPPNSKAIIIGHSNGGQGTWYLASRFPDRVLAAIPAAAYIKSQSYVPLSLSRSAHFIDPALRSILESSLTPDDNDLHLSNLVDIPILAIHGGDDENVPVWHTREAVGLLKILYPTKDVFFKEDQGKGHWYAGVLRNPTTKSFIEKVTSSTSKTAADTAFTLTTATPHECGSLRGWKIYGLKVPGRVGKLFVSQETGDSRVVVVKTSNIQVFGLPTQLDPFTLVVDEQTFYFSRTSESIYIQCEESGVWKVRSALNLESLPPGRLQAILSSEGPISIVISDMEEEREQCLALRIAHMLHIYHRLDSEIITEGAAFTKTQNASWGSGNIVFIGKPTSAFAKDMLNRRAKSVRIVNSAIHILDKRFDKQGQAMIFTHPHPSHHGNLMLFLIYNDASGLERAARLFPCRTGVASPDWVVIGERAEMLGAAGVDAAGVWASDWTVNLTMSWFP